MISISRDAGRLDEANEKALSPVCAIHVQKIFALLHAQAIQAAQRADAKIQIENTAADGNDAKSAVFHSAGEHMIVARSTEQDNDKNPVKISREAAMNALTAYIGTFCGADVASGLKADECFPLEGGEAGGGSSGGWDGEGDDFTGDEEDGGASSMGESAGPVPSFSVFLSEATGIKVLLEAGDDADVRDGNDGDEAGDEDPGDEAGDDDEADEMGDEEDGDEAGEAQPGDPAGSADDEDPADGNGKGTGGKEKPDPSKILADGWYILYGLKIKGLKETTAKDALLKWGSDFLKGFGVKLGSMWGGGSGELHTVGGLVKDVKSLFGAIDDPDQLASRIDSELKKKFPEVSINSVHFRDKKTVIADLEKTHREGFDGKAKQKINSAEYSLCIQLKETNPAKPFVNRKILANIVTLQIKGLFKKFKNMVKADDIIYLKGDMLNTDDGYTSKDVIRKIPTPSELNSIIKNEKNGNNGKEGDPGVAYSKIQEKFKKVLKDDKLKSSPNGKKFIDLWEELETKFKGKTTSITFDDLTDFVEKYDKQYSADDDKNESINADVSSIFDMLFENGSVCEGVAEALDEMDPLCAVFEEEEKKDEKKDEKKTKDDEKKD
jgi:hypothetical protein